MSIVLILYILYTFLHSDSRQSAGCYSSVFQQSGNGRGGNYSNKPGWADYVSDLYKDSRDMGKMWCNAGSLVKARYLSFIANRSQDVNNLLCHPLHQTSRKLPA